MGRYRKIDVRVHGDERVSRLSRPDPNAYTLWLYLLSCPFSTNVPGIFRSGEAALAEDLRWPLKGFRQVFGEVMNEGLAKYDAEARVVWLPNAIKYNAPESPNVVKSWRNPWDELPECTLKYEAWRALKVFVEGIGKGFGLAFLKACPEPLANQEQEQEQQKASERDSSQASTYSLFASESAEKNTAPAHVAIIVPPLHGFEEWYTAYPRKEARGDAEKAWTQVVATRPILATMLETLAWQRPLWAAKERQFTPLPATYLRAKRWLDQRPTGGTNVGPNAPRTGNSEDAGKWDREADRLRGGSGADPSPRPRDGVASAIR